MHTVSALFRPAGLAAIILATIFLATASCTKKLPVQEKPLEAKPAEVQLVIDAILGELGAKLNVNFAKDGLLNKIPPVYSFEMFGDKYSFESERKRENYGGITWKELTSTFFLSYLLPTEGSKKTKNEVFMLSFSLPQSYHYALFSEPYLHLLDDRLVLNKTTKSEVDNLLGKPGRLITDKTPVGPWNITDQYTYYNPRDKFCELWVNFNDEGILVKAALVLHYDNNQRKAK
jgi:hypothetical protein